MILDVPGTNREVILHPPHLMDSDGKLMPAAFIPICAYQGHLLGVTSPELNFTACDLFEPTLVQNQLCYSLNFTKTKNWKTKTTSENGLLLVIDGESSLTEGKTVDASSESESFGRFFIHTLSHFNDTRSGDYVLDSLKKMTGTKQFLGLTDEKKECQVEVFEICEQRKFLEKITQQCCCVPWIMNTGFKVIIAVLNKLRNSAIRRSKAEQLYLHLLSRPASVTTPLISTI